MLTKFQVTLHVEQLKFKKFVEKLLKKTRTIGAFYNWHWAHCFATFWIKSIIWINVSVADNTFSEALIIENLVFENWRREKIIQFVFRLQEVKWRNVCIQSIGKIVAETGWFKKIFIEHLFSYKPIFSIKFWFLN